MSTLPINLRIIELFFIKMKSNWKLILFCVVFSVSNLIVGMAQLEAEDRFKQTVQFQKPVFSVFEPTFDLDLEKSRIFEELEVVPRDAYQLNLTLEILDQDGMSIDNAGIILRDAESGDLLMRGESGRNGFFIFHEINIPKNTGGIELEIKKEGYVHLGSDLFYSEKFHLVDSINEVVYLDLITE